MRYEFDTCRFWKRVEKTETCWLWTGTRNSAGYGQLTGKLSARRCYLRAHRVSFEIVNGPIPDGMLVDHICQVRSCVRPDHLRLATAKQNQEHRVGAQSNSSTGVRGVSWHQKAGKWEAQVTHHQKKKYLGLFTSIEEATEAVTAYRNEVFTRNDRDRSAA